MQICRQEEREDEEELQEEDGDEDEDKSKEGEQATDMFPRKSEPLWWNMSIRPAGQGPAQPWHPYIRSGEQACVQLSTLDCPYGFVAPHSELRDVVHYSRSGTVL